MLKIVPVPLAWLSHGVSDAAGSSIRTSVTKVAGVIGTIAVHIVVVGTIVMQIAGKGRRQETTQRRATKITEMANKL